MSESSLSSDDLWVAQLQAESRLSALVYPLALQSWPLNGCIKFV